METFEFLLVRGLARETGHWGPFTDLLRDQPYCHRLHLIDLPGAGRFHKLTSPLTIGENAEFILTQLPEKCERPLCVIAISLGAMVSIEMALRQQRFHSLVLMNTSVANLSPVHHRLQLQNWKKIVNIVKSQDLQSRELEILRMVSQRPELWPKWSAEFASMAERRPMAVSNFLRQLIAASLYRVPEKGPECPILLLSSLGDRTVDPSCSEDLAEHWQLPLRTHPSAGHDLPLDAPEWVLEQIEDFLK